MATEAEFQERRASHTVDRKLQSGVTLHQQGRLAEAEKLYEEILDHEPNHFDALHLLGVIAYQTGRLDRAANLISKAIGIDATLAEAHSNLGNALKDLKRFDEAIASYGKAMALKPHYAEAFYNRGLALQELKRFEQALADYDEAIVLRPDYAEAYSNRGAVFQALQRHSEALTCYDKAIALRPDYAEAYSNRGVVFQALKRPEEALASFDKAISLKPDYAEAYSNRGNALKELKRLEEAVASYDSALNLKREYAMAHSNRGVALQELKRFEEALASYNKAISLKPDYAEAYSNRGTLLFTLDRFHEALEDYERAIKLKPDQALAYANKAGTLNKLKRHNEAAGAYKAVLDLDSHYPFAKGLLLRQKMLCCDWDGIEDLIAEIDRDITLGRLSAEPFGWQGISNSQKSLQLCAELFNKEKYHSHAGALPRRPTAKTGKIRIGYLSGEFRDHATSHLLVGVLEQHDRSHFDIYIFDNGWDDNSEIRGRINSSASTIIDIRNMSDAAAAEAIRNNEIDILVNLRGYSGEQRTEVVAQRCAPIQVNFLGFPGTLGAGYMDYIIGDRHVIPEYHKPFYAEKIVYLPYCYQANDAKKKIAERQFTRSEVGLPEEGFVFCSFNNVNKITPATFDVWMRILQQVEGSVLWLLEVSTATGNLRKEAILRGVEASRLVFAPRMGLPDHLARHRLADLFLDTLPCNAHTTASDALWAGLPVLTQTGETFAGRVAASLLEAIELPELITRTPEAYEALAIELATNLKYLANIKSKLAANRLRAPLFDTKLFTRHIEAAYTAMQERCYAGLEPDHISIDA